MSIKDEIRARMLALMSRDDYMPLRKRGLAKRLKLNDDEYRDFRQWLDDWMEEGVIAMLKRGKFGRPPGPNAAPAFRQSRNLKTRPPVESTAKDQDDADDESDYENNEKGRDGLPHEPIVGAPEELQYAQPEFSERPGNSGADPDHILKIKSRLPKFARVGRIEVKRGGFGFLLSEPPGDDWFVGADDLGGAMNGDIVAALPKDCGGFGGRRFKDRGSRKKNGRVIKIVQRNRVQIIGTFYSYKRKEPGEAGWSQSAELGKLAARQKNQALGGYLVADARGLFDEIDILPEHTRNAKDGDKVAIELIEPDVDLRQGGKPTGCVVEVFGEAGDARAEVQAVLKNYNLKAEFPPEVNDQVSQIPNDIPEEELKRRVDYTQPGMPITFTIDPPDAKDHDDAVGLRRLEDGRWELLVHIADVSHYIPFGTPLDKEAERRATSVYFPGSVIPMLPQKLSNNLCSLKEGLVRLTKTAVITYTRNMIVDKVRIEKSFIKSAAFLTYDQVKEGVEKNDATIVRSPEILETLKEMRSFATTLRKKRMDDGSIDLDLPEIKLLLDDAAKVVGFQTVTHHWAHQLIEDMMLAANRAVANHLVENELLGLFRIHEEPDEEDIERFAEFIEEYDLRMKRPYDRFAIKRILDKVKGQEIAETINMAALTSMKQAVYSAECKPHYALAFTQYLHFTSPIRRYPDTVVHRSLDSRFGPAWSPGQNLPPYPILARGKKRKGGVQTGEHHERVGKLVALAQHCSRREREAADAEEEIKKVRLIEYLRSNKRDSHQGVITHVRDFGFFVKMLDTHMEGQVRLEDMHDDDYEYIREKHLLQGRRKQRSFQLGDRVQVRVTSIDLGARKVFMSIV